MKVLILKPSAPGPYKKYKQSRGGPPQNIFSLAACTPAHVQIELVDETGGMTVPRRTDADLVAMFFSTPDAPHAYRIADRYRAEGATVVIGGLHATFLPDEAAEYADALLLGEAENTWPQLLDDAASGQLRPRYDGEPVEDLATLNPYPTDLVSPSQYQGLWSVLVQRGCRLRCSFCLVHRFFESMRYRPIGHVVDEIRASGAKWFELHADHLSSDRDYALELFRAIEPLGIQWVGETSIRIAKDDELLEAAARSGCAYLLIGIETPSKQALKAASKGFVKPDEIKEAIARIHEHRIVVDSSMLFGLDGQDPDIFEEALDFVRYVEIDVCDAIIAIPFPGSAWFAELEAEGRILTRDWSKYDGAHAVFQPTGMTPEELDYGAGWFWWKYNTPAEKAKRKARQVRNVGWTNAFTVAW